MLFCLLWKEDFGFFRGLEDLSLQIFALIVSRVWPKKLSRRRFGLPSNVIYSSFLCGWDFGCFGGDLLRGYFGFESELEA